MQNRILALATAALLSGLATASYGAPAYALTDDNSLLGFDTATPSSTTSAVILKSPENAPIQDIIGIDFRPSDGLLYGVGKFGAVYTIDPTTGVSTQVSTLQADPGDPTFTYSGLNGSRFGLDFNPVPDRLRITSDADQNLRINVDNGNTTTDTTLSIGGGNPNLVAAAYTNNDNDLTTGTSLYAIDTVTDQLYLSTNPNNGTYVPVGSLGFDATSLSGFDITTVNGVNQAFAALLPSNTSGSRLFTINLATGLATPIGTIGGGDFADGLAIAIPEPTSLAAIAGGLLVAGIRRRRGQA